MEMFYYLLFGALGAVVAALELSKNNKDRIITSSAFNSFNNNYLVVYSLMMGTLLLPLIDLISLYTTYSYHLPICIIFSM